jgi:hypothetical protein
MTAVVKAKEDSGVVCLCTQFLTLTDEDAEMGSRDGRQVGVGPVTEPGPPVSVLSCIPSS